MKDIKEILKNNEIRISFFILPKEKFLATYPSITEEDYETIRTTINEMDLPEYVSKFMPQPRTTPVVLEEEAEFIGQIIDTFEDFLDEKGIVIPNEDRDSDEELDPENSANIYGEDYDYLSQELRKILTNWKIIQNEEENPKPWFSSN